ncbi:phytanoyl-CoA dioxygenase family protein [Thalassotalea litorea]|uniref:Phytanoyl-CoA dioxygenase family protein n=1 Tax=Thalassotalea litorea TaxID=2020715 RepID=A0A5R9IPL7_9GAMM|nr:phytanoyl-CoA dioxygenase family protein [Thalassotalea litorea]TLU67485.1 phytanoyl-CoA dioxygenase family protein [Thalassotalea litorea]
MKQIKAKPDISLITTYHQQYEADGYFIIPECFKSPALQALTAEVERIYQFWMSDNERDVQQYAMVNMHGLTEAIYFQGGECPDRERGHFFNSLVPINMIETLSGVFGNKLYFHNTQLFFNPYKNRRKPYWHRDTQYNGKTEDVQKDYLKTLLNLHIRIPLIDEVGIELIPGTHRRWDTDKERNVRLQLSGNENHQPLPGSKLIDLKAGDALVFSAQMIHRGHYCKPQRLALDLCVGKPHPDTIKYIDNKHLPLQSQIQYINNPCWYENAINHLDDK